jgi:hypothetical protein
VAVISTPNCLHANQAVASLDRGFDVYVVRPLVTQLKDARVVAHRCRRRWRAIHPEGGARAVCPGCRGDGARKNLHRHPTYILAAYMAAGI